MGLYDDHEDIIDTFRVAHLYNHLWEMFYERQFLTTKIIRIINIIFINDNESKHYQMIHNNLLI